MRVSLHRAGDLDIYWQAADLSGDPELLSAREHSQFLGSWSPDGSELVFGEEHPETGRDMWLFNLADPTVPTPLLTTAANENQAAFSPDGRWLAYTSDETGRDEVYVMAMPSTGRRQAITGDGGSEPQWSPDGRQLYFRRGSTLLTVDLREEGGELTPESPRTLPVSATWHNTWFQGYDVASDGRVLVISGVVFDEVQVVVNWYDELSVILSPDS